LARIFEDYAHEKGLNNRGSGVVLKARGRKNSPRLVEGDVVKLT